MSFWCLETPSSPPPAHLTVRLPHGAAWPQWRRLLSPLLQEKSRQNRGLSTALSLKMSTFTTLQSVLWKIRKEGGGYTLNTLLKLKKKSFFDIAES